MCQPWEEYSGSTIPRQSLRKKVKTLIKAAPMAVMMIGLTYGCFIYMSLVKRRETQ